MAYEGLMVSVSGVRGRVGEGLTPEIVARFAAGFGAWARKRSGVDTPTIVVGRDSRISGPMFHRVVLSALQSVGCNVMDVGMAPTPTIQLAVEHHHAAGGLAITASHNPIEWNALKFIGPSGLFLDGAEAAEMRAVVEGDIPRVTWDKLGTVDFDPGAIERHQDMILALPFLDVDGIRRADFTSRSTASAARAARSCRASSSASAAECRRSISRPTAAFRARPSPCRRISASWRSWCAHPAPTSALRLTPTLTVSRSFPTKGRQSARITRSHSPRKLFCATGKGPIVTNLSTSRIVDDIAREQNRQVIRAPVGEVNVATRMRSEKAAIGGEGNGGVILSELHLGRDAPVGAALILQLLHEESASLSAIVARYPRYFDREGQARPAGGSAGFSVQVVEGSFS